MDINKILSADILDIVFEGRNKDYGAYELRKTYNRRLTRALIFTAILVAVILIPFAISSLLPKPKADIIQVVDTQIAEIKQKDPTPPPPPPPPVKPPPPPAVNQVKFTPPVVKKDNEVKKDEKPPDIKDSTAISSVTIKSANTQQIVQAPIDDKGTGVVQAPVPDDNTVFTKVEVDAQFPGGMGAWAKFLQRNLDPDVPVNNGAPVGTYRVIIRFIVGKDGSASDIQPQTSFGYGMEEEAIRAIKRAPKWTPAIQNGRNVNAYKIQPITFVVSGDD